MKMLETLIGGLWKKAVKTSFALMVAVPLTLGIVTEKAAAQSSDQHPRSSLHQQTQLDFYIPKLEMLVPGINDNGMQMLENAKRALRYDPLSTIIIQEAEGWTANDRYLKGDMAKVVQHAMEKNTDVIVLVDMDLEHSVMRSHLTPEAMADLPGIGTRWFAATDWAGAMINFVAETYDTVFQEQGGKKGKKGLDAHSAGVDAFEQSLALSKGRLFDQVNLFNGRTTTSELVPQLATDGYTAEEVRLFLTGGELPANPHSVSNLRAVQDYAGKAFTVYFNDTMPSRNPIANHSDLINRAQTARSFQVYAGDTPYSIHASVVSIQSGEAIPRMPFQGKVPAQGIENKLGGVIFDTENTYLVDQDGTVKAIGEALVAARPEKESITWEFQHGGKTYRAVALPFEQEEKLTKPEYHHNEEQNIVLSFQGDTVTAIRYVRHGTSLQVVQIAKGKVVGEKDNRTMFRIEDMIMTDYPVIIPKN